MGKIIKFDVQGNARRKTVSNSLTLADTEFAEAVKNFEESDEEKGMEDLFSAIKKLAHAVSSGPEVEEMIRISEKRQKEFLEKNKELIDAEPKFDAGLRMQYYAQILLKLAVEIFHTKDGFYKPLDDFSYFMDFYNSAFSKYSSQYSELEEDYCFTGKVTYDIKVLEAMLTDCLVEILQLRPNESDYDRTRLLYNGNRLSELYCNLLDYHADVIMKNKKQ